MDLPQTRASLMLRLRDRSEDAWGEFLSIYERALVQFARRKGLQEADARDVTQDVLAAVEKKVDDWDGDHAVGRFRGWLFRVARNLAVDRVVQHARRLSQQGHRGGSVLDQAVAREGDVTEFGLDYRRQLMGWAADQVRPAVSEVSWRAFQMTAIEGVDGASAAHSLGISKGAVYAAKFRVIARLKSVMDRLDDPDAARGVPSPGSPSPESLGHPES